MPRATALLLWCLMMVWGRNGEGDRADCKLPKRFADQKSNKDAGCTAGATTLSMFHVHGSGQPVDSPISKRGSLGTIPITIRTISRHCIFDTDVCTLCSAEVQVHHLLHAFCWQLNLRCPACELYGNRYTAPLHQNLVPLLSKEDVRFECCHTRSTSSFVAEGAWLPASHHLSLAAIGQRYW